MSVMHVGLAERLQMSRRRIARHGSGFTSESAHRVQSREGRKKRRGWKAPRQHVARWFYGEAADKPTPHGKGWERFTTDSAHKVQSREGRKKHREMEDVT